MDFWTRTDLDINYGADIEFVAFIVYILLNFSL